MIKKLIKSNITFGLGVLFGAVIAAISSWVVMSISYGNPDLERILDIRECLEEKNDE